MVSSETQKGIFAHTFLYSTGNFLTRGLNFILLPIYSHYISPPEFGVYSVIISIVTIASTILNLGLPSIFVKNLSEFETASAKRKFISNVISGITALSIPILIFVVIFSKKISWIVIGSETYDREIILGILSVFSLNYSYYFSAFFIAEQNSKRFVFVNSISALINFILNVFLIVVLKSGIDGIFISQILSSIVLILLAKDVVKNFFHFEIDLKYLNPILISSLPLLFSGIFTIVVELIDRFIVLKLLGEEQAGIYSFGYRIALIYNLFILSFKSAWIPHYFQLKGIDEEEKSKHIGRVFTKLVYLSAVLILTIQIIIKILFSTDFISFQIFNPAYKSSQSFIIYVMLGYFFSLMMAFYSIAPYKFNKTNHFLIADLLAMITNLVFNFLLIPEFGLIGAALATMFAFMIGALYLFLFSNQKIKVEYQSSLLVPIIMISGLAIFGMEIYEGFIIPFLSLLFLVMIGFYKKLLSRNFFKILK